MKMTSKRHLALAGATLATGILLSGCAMQPPAHMASVEKMYVFNCGRLEVADVSLFTGRPQDKGKAKMLTDSCYLIIHKNGTLLWDTGLPDGIAKMPGASMKNGPFTLSVETPFVAQLKRMGFAPERIRYVAFSHMHGDHAGNANAFSASTVLMQQAEYDAAFGPHPEKFRFNPNTYGKLKNSKFIKLHGDYDVFGDGSVVIKSTPGHTPGHQSLFVRLPKSGPVLLSGDLVHFEDNWVHKRVPVFNFSKKESLQSMAKMETFLKETGAKLLIQHDAEQNRNVPHAPQAYE